MQRFKNYFLLFCFVFIIGCGYSPLLKSKNNSFYINELIFEGNRQINNYFFANLKRYKKIEENAKKYNLKIISTYEKRVTNKDNMGNPKNFNLQAKIDVSIKDMKDGSQLNKSFERNISLSVQEKKINEAEQEKKYKKNLVNLLSDDILFFLTNQ